MPSSSPARAARPSAWAATSPPRSPPAREVFQEVDETLEAKALQADVRRARRGTHPDREHPAGADGAFARGAAGAGEGRRLHACARRPWWSPAIRSANTARWPRPARSPSPTRRGCCGCAARPCSRRCPAGDGAMAALLGADMALAQEICAEAAPIPSAERRRRGPGGRRRGRQNRSTEVIEPANDNGGGQVVISGARAAVERAVEIAKSQGRPPRHAAAGVRPVPLRPDGARPPTRWPRRWPPRRPRRRSCR